MPTHYELLKDTTFGYLLRAVLGPKVLPHCDELHFPAAFAFAQEKQSGSEVYSRKAELDAERHDIEETRRATLHPQDTGSGGFSRTSTLADIAAYTLNQSEKADTLLVGWYGPDDPDNPQNWSSAKKGWVLFQTCFLTFSIYIGSSIYTAGLTSVEDEFHVSPVAATLGLTMFVAGYGLGPMLWAPLSELPQIGRLPVYMFTSALFVPLLIPTALASNFGMLLASRFLTGFFGSPALANGGATISDIYHPKHRAYGLILWGLFATLGPVLGPLVGGFAAYAKGWTWTIWELMWLSGAALVLLFFFFPETSPDNILYRRAQRLRKATGHKNLRAQSEIDAAQTTDRERLVEALIIPISLNFYEPIVLVLNVYIGLIYALLYLWFESFPIVFIGTYGFSEQLLGLSYIGILVGALSIVPPYFAYLKYRQEPRYSASGELRPEERMPVAIFAAPFIAISLFIFGWSARESVHWVVPIIGSALFGMGILLLFNVVLNYLADAYPIYSASVLAGNDLVRSAFGAGFPLFARAMCNKLGVGWASTLLALLACAFIPIPILLYRYGERIRRSSKRARHEFS
ncbi:benomyl/methotrexate resistance protein [Peniophora sp. CONT]|nr:benomyl/methotrexate resistance protein [Peniophora sp. CONT]